METRANAATAEGISGEELQLAARNHGMPLEALRYPITPVGLHYLLIHYDIPLVDHLKFGIGGLVSKYGVPAGLTPFYGSDPTSYMVFFRLKVS